MFKNLEDFLAGNATLEIDKGGELTSRELKVSTLVLLAEIAFADKIMSPEELSQICSSMLKEFGLWEAETGEMLEIAAYLARERGKTDSFMEAINKHFNPDQKMHLLAMIWKVIRADGRADEAEAKAGAEARRRLGLSMEQAVRAQMLSDEPDFVPIFGGSE